MGGITFVLAFLPIVIWQHRRYGDWERRRLVGAAMASVYAASLVTYTLLPLPDRADVWCSAHSKALQMTPFQFVDDIAQKTAGLSWRQSVKQPVFLQVIFNVIFFLPWGVLARRWAGQSFRTAVLTGFGASLMIETTQASGLWGIYPCAYRLGDVDDLFLNTLGAAVGAVLAPAFLWWMPSSDALSASRGIPRPVTTRRRYTGMVIDMTLAVTVVSAALLAGGFLCHIFMSCSGRHYEVVGRIGAVIAWAAVWGIPACQGSGASLGQRMVWLEPRWPDPKTGLTGRGTVPRRLLRSLVVPGFWMLGVMVPMMSGLTLLVLLLALVAVPLSRTRGLSGLLSGAFYVDSREIPAFLQGGTSRGTAVSRVTGD
ncbi:hypothetical protein AUCHE_05_02830 [Austwickia chelonae NBRC 105200]|uniref:VanZ-like domain-containing protein n=1 Tax=Austwickia chelonae NBRC 105200 TaxID=1184607 RepID=K6VKV0_9MICO|nr:hypothetical protein AUCHE_05_02830 [Austwickia chelonae NBRC 105200]